MGTPAGLGGRIWSWPPRWPATRALVAFAGGSGRLIWGRARPPQGRLWNVFPATGEKKLAAKEGMKGRAASMNSKRMARSKPVNRDRPRPSRPTGRTRQERKPDQRAVGRPKKVPKKRRVPLKSSCISVSMPKHMKVRIRRCSWGHMASQAAEETASPDRRRTRSESARESASTAALASVLESWKPVDGCTMPAVPPMPITRWLRRGRTPPMGMRQCSSSRTRVTVMPSACRRCFIRSLMSSKSTPGRATRLVSSQKMRPGLKGMTYRKVGRLPLRALDGSSRWLSRQSMNSISPVSNGWLSTSARMPYAAW